MKYLDRILVIRDSHGNDVSKPWTLIKYDTVQEAINSLGEGYVLHWFNFVQEQQARTNARMEVLQKNREKQ